ncbi:MAG TPA: PaaI family thioesterase [Kineosporiaceae bacterium]|nr:PaaI family thioesterase [Kineosporiaceae bacterium]
MHEMVTTAAPATAEPCAPAHALPEWSVPEDLPAGLADVMRAAGVGTGGLYRKLGMTVTEALADRVVASMPVAGNTQPFGLLHGGASIAFAETLASIGALLLAGPGQLAVGIEVSASHHASVRDGTVHGTATLVHRGSTLAHYDVRITDDDGRLVCTCRVTCLLRKRRAVMPTAPDTSASPSPVTEPTSL